MEASYKQNQIKTNERLGVVEARLAKLEEQQNRNDKMTTTLDDITQERRNMSLIFTGLKTTDAKKEIVQTAMSWALLLGRVLLQVFLKYQLRIQIKPSTKFNFATRRNKMRYTDAE